MSFSPNRAESVDRGLKRASQYSHIPRPCPAMCSGLFRECEEDFYENLTSRAREEDDWLIFGAKLACCDSD
jgi:hypothetical protein